MLTILKLLANFVSYHKNKTTRHWQTAKHLVSFQLSNLTHTYRVRLGVSLQKRREEEVQTQPAD